MIKNIIAMALMLIPTLSFAQGAVDDSTATAETNAIIENFTQNLKRGNAQQKIRPRYGVMLSKIPASVGSPSYSGTFTYFKDSAVFTLWRENVEGKWRLFIQVKPISNTFFFCVGGGQFSIIQNGKDYLGEDFNATRGDNKSVCDHLNAPEIFLVDQWNLYTSVEEDGSFTISYPDKTTNFSGSINVAAADGSFTPPTNGVGVFNSTSGELTLPDVTVGKDHYSAILLFQGNDLFRLKSAAKK